MWKKLFLNFLGSNFCNINTEFCKEVYWYGEKTVKFQNISFVNILPSLFFLLIGLIRKLCILGFKLFKQRLTYAIYDSLIKVGHKYMNLVGKKRQKWPHMLCIIFYKNDLCHLTNGYWQYWAIIIKTNEIHSSVPVGSLKH